MLHSQLAAPLHLVTAIRSLRRAMMDAAVPTQCCWSEQQNDTLRSSKIRTQGRHYGWLMQLGYLRPHVVAGLHGGRAGCAGAARACSSGGRSGSAVPGAAGAARQCCCRGTRAQARRRPGRRGQGAPQRFQRQTCCLLCSAGRTLHRMSKPVCCKQVTAPAADFASHTLWGED